MSTLRIALDDPRRPECVALLQEHLAAMRATSPPESKHALDLDGLCKPELSFYTARDGEALAGFGALKALDASHGEIKSMCTAAGFQRRGVARTVLEHLLGEARSRGYARVSLETGSMPYFEPARRLYAGFGFVVCAPFAPYKPDPNSVFMTLELRSAGAPAP